MLLAPVDGSLNAKQGLPLFGMMLALLDGPAIQDTVAGCVVNLVTGESWTAIRKQGAFRAGQPFRALPSRHTDRLQVLGLEMSARSSAAAQPPLATWRP